MKYSVGMKGRVLQKNDMLPEGAEVGTKFEIKTFGTPKYWNIEVFGVTFDGVKNGVLLEKEGNPEGWYITNNLLDHLIEREILVIGDPRDTKIKIPGMGG